MTNKKMTQSDFKTIRAKNVLSSSKSDWITASYPVSIRTINRINAIKFLLESSSFLSCNNGKAELLEFKRDFINAQDESNISIDVTAGKKLSELFWSKLSEKDSVLHQAFILGKINEKLLEYEDNSNLNFKNYHPDLLTCQPEISNYDLLIEEDNNIKTINRINPYLKRVSNSKEDFVTTYFILAAYYQMYVTLYIAQESLETAEYCLQKIYIDNVKGKKPIAMPPSFFKKEQPAKFSWKEMINMDVRRVYNYIHIISSLSFERRVRICEFEYCGFLYYGSQGRKFCAAHDTREVDAARQKRYREESLNKK